MSREELAEAAGLSPSAVKAIETGKRQGRMATLAQLARALGVSTTDLLVPAAGAHVAHDADPDGILAVRRVLTPALGIDPVVTDPPPTLESWRETLSYAERLYSEDRYAAVLEAVPVLLEDAAALHRSVPDGAKALLQAYLYTAQTLTQLRQLDLANHALDKAMRLAHELSDELIVGWIAFIQGWTLLLQRRFRDVEHLAVQTAERIEPRISAPPSPQLTAWGWLMVRAASAAIRDARTDDAEEYMSQARTAAARLGEGYQSDTWMPMLMRGFGITAAGFKDVENAVLIGEHGKALHLAKRIPPSDRPSVNTRNRHQIDIASAHLAERRPADAIERLMAVRAAAPEWLRHQGYARGVIAQLVEHQKRAHAEQIGVLADHVGLPL